MNKEFGLTAENLMRALPPVLNGNADMAALAEVLAEVLAERGQEAESLRIYFGIDTLPEELLDILAKDFKVDWWDSDYTLEEKRKTLKESWRVHRMLGTKAAVETAISAIYPNTKVSEWWEYGGDPCHFKLAIDATFENVDAEKHKRVMEKVEYYKNMRSVLDEIEYYDSGGTAAQFVGAAFLGCEIVDSATAFKY